MKIFVVFILLFCCCYVFFTVITIKQAEKKISSPDGKYFLFLTKKPPLMSFGSGKTEIRLYTSYYLHLGKCMLGEFPFEIEEWDLKTKEILIKIRQHNLSNDSYVRQYTDGNNRIGNFKIIYQIIYDVM
jgi:hypothetical protein